MTRWLLLAVVIVSCQGCPHPTPTPAPNPPPIASATCAQACAHLDQLGCPNHGSCPGICAALADPAFSTCLAAAATCAAADACDHR